MSGREIRNLIIVSILAVALSFSVAYIVIPFFTDAGPADNAALRTERPSLSLPSQNQDGSYVKTDNHGILLNREQDAEQAEQAEDTSQEALDTSFASVLERFGNFDFIRVEGVGEALIEIPSVPNPCLMSINYSGDDFLTVSTENDSNTSIETLVAQNGPYQGVVSDYFAYNEATLLHLEGAGEWSVVFSPMISARRIANGETFSGDGIVYIDEEALSTLHITHDGSGPFIVRASSTSSAAVLVNTTGSYDDSIAWSDPQTLFVIQASGSWSLSWE